MEQKPPTHDQYQSYQQAVEEALQEFPLLAGNQVLRAAALPPPAEGEIPEPLRSAMRYSLLLPGKRLRPVLLLASYTVVQSDWQHALPFACALEMIHTYSLIHDDLPAMDDDELRRGKPANHKVFGENIAILAGDGLLNLAYETMLAAPMSTEKPTQAMAAIREIASRAGACGMIAGQTLDVMLEGASPSAELVRYIHQHKTADLLTAPVVAGLLLAGASPDQLTAGRVFGTHLGLAFQMVDDLLDIGGDALAMGKQTGMDAARGKITWPAVAGVEQTRLDAQQAVAKATEALSPWGSSGIFLCDLARQTLVRAK